MMMVQMMPIAGSFPLRGVKRRPGIGFRSGARFVSDCGGTVTTGAALFFYSAAMGRVQQWTKGCLANQAAAWRAACPVA